MSSFEYFECEHSGDVCVATCLLERIDNELIMDVMGNQLCHLVEQEGIRFIIIDFSTTEYLSAAFLSKLVTLRNKTDKAHGRLIFCEVRPDIYEVFATTKLNAFFRITYTLEQALEEMRTAST